MFQLRIVLAVLAVALVTTSCQPAAEQEPAARPAPVEIEVAKGPVSVEPARLESCDVGAVVKLRWDLRRDHPNVSTVEIWTARPAGNLILFAASGAAGEADTGPWTIPGQTFEIRDRATGKPLTTVKVLGPDCP